jgi:hypothetical protein
MPIKLHVLSLGSEQALAPVRLADYQKQDCFAQPNSGLEKAEDMK